MYQQNKVRGAGLIETWMIFGLLYPERVKDFLMRIRSVLSVKEIIMIN